MALKRSYLFQKWLSGFLSLIAFFGIFSSVWGTDFSSSNFIMRDPVGSGGGGYATSTNFQIFSAFSQPAIGKSTSNSNELRAGFLYFSAVTATSPSPAPAPTPTPPPSTGSGSVTTPISVGTTTPPLASLISFITGEKVPVACIGVNRSDLNCDGAVNLKDLSVLISRPKLVTVRILSLLFADWTQRLPVLAYSFEPPSASATQEITAPVSGLAQFETAFSGTTTAPTAPPRASVIKNLFSGFINLVKLVFKFIAAIFGF